MTFYQRDTFLTPIEITTANQVILIREDPSGAPNNVTVTLTPGTYFLHDDSSFHASRLGLYFAILDVINNGTGVNGTLSGVPTNTYTMVVSAPSASTGLTNAGVTLEALAAADDFQIIWASTTMDARWFGFKDASPATTSSATSGPDELIVSPNGVKHRLVTHDLGNGSAIDKEPDPWKITRRSSDLPKDSITLTWGTGLRRHFTYRDIPPPFVFERRAEESEFAGEAGLETGDANNIWHDVWDAYTAGCEVVIVHNESSDLQIDTHEYEVTKLFSEVGSLRQFAPRMPGADGGDFREVRFVAAVDPLFENYPH